MKTIEVGDLYTGDDFYHKNLKHRMLLQRTKDLESEKTRCYCYKTRKQVFIPYETVVEVESFEFPSTGPED